MTAYSEYFVKRIYGDILSAERNPTEYLFREGYGTTLASSSDDAEYDKNILDILKDFFDGFDYKYIKINDWQFMLHASKEYYEDAVTLDFALFSNDEHFQFDVEQFKRVMKRQIKINELL